MVNALFSSDDAILYKAMPHPRPEIDEVCRR